MNFESKGIHENVNSLTFCLYVMENVDGLYKDKYITKCYKNLKFIAI